MRRDDSDDDPLLLEARVAISLAQSNKVCFAGIRNCLLSNFLVEQQTLLPIDGSPVDAPLTRTAVEAQSN